MRLRPSEIVLAHLIKGDDDGDPALQRSPFLPPSVTRELLPLEAT